MVTSEEQIQQFREYLSDPAARAAFVEMKAQHAEQGTAHRYEHVLRLVGSRPWAIDDAMLAVIVDVLTFRAFGGRLTAEEIEGRIGAARRTPSSDSVKGVARISVSGVLIPRANMMNEMSGGTSAEALTRSIRAAVASPDVASIVLDVDSPGGMVDGIPELAAEIRSAREHKPIVAVANTEALSAAYWLASQADRVFASPSARVGSIGVLSAHEDRSGQDATKGVKTTLISAGRYKTEGNPFEPLTDEARDHLQSMVDEFYGMFVNDVAAGRRVAASEVAQGFGQGRYMGAKAALDAGLIDGIDTIENVIKGELVNAAASGRQVATSPSVTLPGGGVGSVAAGRANIYTYTVPVTNTNIDYGQAVAHTETPEPEPLPDPEPPMPDPIPEPMVEDPEAQALAEKLHLTSQESEIESLHARLDKAAEGPGPAGVQAAVDESSWDGNRAMGECNGSGDYRSICAAEHTIGTPDQRQHWALPHHYLGRGPNAAGVRAALSRISQTQNITDEQRARAQRHLDAHMREINPGGERASQDAIAEIEAISAELAVLGGME